MKSSTLILSPPSINPEEYLGTEGARKVADVRLTSPASHWGDEITQSLLREHPYIPANRILVNFKQRDDAQGYAIAYVSIDGCPRISIPVVITQRRLKPMDIMVLRSDRDMTADQGAGNFQDDQVVPLTEQTFSQALDAGDVGDVVADQNVKGTGWSEDGSALRLPLRGRTVLASVMGTTETQKKAFIDILGKDQEIATGFAMLGDVANQWMNSPDPARSVQNKLASVQIEAATAHVIGDLPEEKKTADFAAAPVLLEDGSYKLAVNVAVVDLADPIAVKNILLFEDGRYCASPVKVAVAKSGKTELEQVGEILSKQASRGIHRGEIIAVEVEDYFTQPMKVAAITVHENTDTIELQLTDGLRDYPLFMHRGIKTASMSPNGTWIVPVTNRVLKFAAAKVEPASMERTAQLLTKMACDSLHVAGGVWSLDVKGHPRVSLNGVDETKMAEHLNVLFANGADLMSMTKEAGFVRFASDLDRMMTEMDKQAENATGCSEVLKQAAKDLVLPLEQAVKLAAAVGDPQGADAVLATGFLSEDNIAEFASLADEFDEIVGKLARLLLLVRLGYPQGDEAAIVVAMKSLQRVAERLRAMMGTVSANPEQVSVG